jgi:NADPH:quinone reductase-like Zn-dependent oxidoreductase
MPAPEATPTARSTDRRTMGQNRAMTTMRAAIRERYGPPEVVHVVELECPTPRDGEVLVRVGAASVNRGDLDGIRAKPAIVRGFMGLRAPRNHRIGLDVAGTVEATGPAVTRFRPGDQVFADLFSHGQGSFADFVCASEGAFETIPDGFTLEEAAALPHGVVLAVQGLRRRDGRAVGPGDRVLIDGASGNVGPFAIQVAKALGAEVTGTARTEKLDFVRSLGADHVIDFTAVDYTTTGQRYDWILDTDSHHPILRVRRALRPGGTYVTLGGWLRPIVAAMTLGPVITAATDKWAGLLLWWKPFAHDDVETLKRLIADGRLRPSIDRRYPLDRIVEALRWVDDGQARGKVIVTP